MEWRCLFRIILLFLAVVNTVCELDTSLPVVPPVLQCGSIAEIKELTVFPYQLRGSIQETVLNDFTGSSIVNSTIIATVNASSPLISIGYVIGGVEIVNFSVNVVTLYEIALWGPQPAPVINHYDLEAGNWSASYLDNDNCTAVFFRQTLPNEAQYHVNYYIFKSDTEINYGNETYPVSANSPKFSLFVTNYNYSTTPGNPTGPRTEFYLNFENNPVLPAKNMTREEILNASWSIDVGHRQKTIPMFFLPRGNNKREITAMHESGLFKTRPVINVDQCTINFTLVLFGVQYKGKDRSNYTLMNASPDSGFPTLLDPGFGSLRLNASFGGIFSNDRSDVLYYDPTFSLFFSGNPDADGDGDGDDYVSGESELAGGSIAAIVICSIFGVIVLIAIIVAVVTVVVKKQVLSSSI